MIRTHLIALTTAAIGFVGAATSSQCLTPDNLSGPCWQPTQANLPNFPQQALPGTAACFTNCSPTQENVRVIVGQPMFTGCAQYMASVTVFDSSTGASILTGSMTMDYTRNWAEAGATDELTVYRFAVKLNFGVGAGPGTACTVPSCVPAVQRAFYYGYMDYAYHCSTPQVESALMLFHNCDGFIHRPGLSAMPGTFHPKTSFAIVAPHTLGNPFVAGINPTPPTGPLIGEATRNVTGPGGSCISEDRIQNGNLQFLADACGCPISLTNPKQLAARRLSGKGTCVDPTVGVSSFMSVKTTPSFPWLHDMTNSIGRWTTGANYPGPEQIWADEVPILFNDSCSAAAGLASTFAEVYYGASSRAGYPVLPTPIGTPVSDKFLDLAANASFPLPGPVALPLVGPVFPTRNLIYTNTP